MSKKAKSARQIARALIVQGLYAILTANSSIKEIEADLMSGIFQNVWLKDFEKNIVQEEQNTQQRADFKYLQNLLESIMDKASQLNEIMSPYIERGLDSINPVEHAILLLGVYELNFRKDVPYKVVINEGIELAKQFGASESHKFVNSVLDRVALENRQESQCH